jgi:hypothetical protein
LEAASPPYPRAVRLWFELILQYPFSKVNLGELALQVTGTSNDFLRDDRGLF